MNSIRRLLSSLKKINENYLLLEEGDSLLVYINGSRSSFGLLESLKIFPYYGKVNFKKIVAIFLDFNDDNEFISSCKNEVERIGFEMKVASCSDMADMLEAKGKHNASSFAKMERKALIEAARKYRCNKIVLPSNYDDLYHSFMVNLEENGVLLSIRPSVRVNSTNKYFIRPFLYVRHTELEEYPLLETKNADRINVNKTANIDSYIYFLKALENMDDHFVLFEDKYITSQNIPFYSLKRITDEKLSCGEKRYSILFSKKEVGRISLKEINAHLVRFYSFKGETLDIANASRILIEDLRKKKNPLSVIFTHPSKELIEELSLSSLRHSTKLFIGLKYKD